MAVHSEILEIWHHGCVHGLLFVRHGKGSVVLVKLDCLLGGCLERLGLGSAGRGEVHLVAVAHFI